MYKPQMCSSRLSDEANYSNSGATRKDGMTSHWYVTFDVNLAPISKKGSPSLTYNLWDPSDDV
jgi:hypothetical protein